jgi:hypothetical protein
MDQIARMIFKLVEGWKIQPLQWDMLKVGRLVW